MIRWHHEHTRVAARLARRAAATRLGARAAGLDTTGYRHRARGYAWHRQPVAQAGTGTGRRRGITAPSGLWPPVSAHRRAAYPAPGTARVRNGSIRLPWPALDLSVGSRGDPTHGVVQALTDWARQRGYSADEGDEQPPVRKRTRGPTRRRTTRIPVIRTARWTRQT